MWQSSLPLHRRIQLDRPVGHPVERERNDQFIENFHQASLSGVNNIKKTFLTPLTPKGLDDYPTIRVI